MPTVGELTAVYGNFLLSPRTGPGVCAVCFNFTDGYDRCYACAHTPQRLDVVLPVSYSVGHEQLHHALALYKRRDDEVSRRLRAELAAVLWRFLDRHERCIANGAGVMRFDLVTTVPSGQAEREPSHPLPHLVADTVEPTRSRYRRLLARSEVACPPRTFSLDKFRATTMLHGDAVLLIDDTWTTGANAQSAAAALKAAGAGRVAALVIGRHLNREWHENDQRLRRFTRPFDWETCALCAHRQPTA